MEQNKLDGLTKWVKQYYSSDFSIEKDWNKLIHSRNIARSIIDKLLSDSKLTPDMIRYVFFIGTNKTTENKEDIVIETQDGKQYSFFLNKNVSTSKSSSFNKLADDLIGDKTDELFKGNYYELWNLLASNWVNLIFENVFVVLQNVLQFELI